MIGFSSVRTFGPSSVSILLLATRPGRAGPCSVSIAGR